MTDGRTLTVWVPANQTEAVDAILERRGETPNEWLQYLITCAVEIHKTVFARVVDSEG